MKNLLAHTDRPAALAAWAGAAALLAGTLLHPIQADPNNVPAAFAEYAANGPWVASHLTQWLGVLLMVLALVRLTRRMADGPGAAWAEWGQAGAVASLGLAGCLQAVDGVALKRVVDAWATAGADRAVLFQAAFAVRQIEIGLAALSSILLGLTLLLFGLAVIADPAFPGWLGWPALVGGLATAVSGVVMAYSGFSELAMDLNMPASALLLVWVGAIGIWLWRNDPSRPTW